MRITVVVADVFVNTGLSGFHVPSLFTGFVLETRSGPRRSVTAIVLLGDLMVMDTRGQDADRGAVNALVAILCRKKDLARVVTETNWYPVVFR